MSSAEYHSSSSQPGLHSVLPSFHGVTPAPTRASLDSTSVSDILDADYAYAWARPPERENIDPVSSHRQSQQFQQSQAHAKFEPWEDEFISLCRRKSIASLRRLDDAYTRQRELTIGMFLKDHSSAESTEALNAWLSHLRSAISRNLTALSCSPEADAFRVLVALRIQVFTELLDLLD